MTVDCGKRVKCRSQTRIHWTQWDLLLHKWLYFLVTDCPTLCGNFTFAIWVTMCPSLPAIGEKTTQDIADLCVHSIAGLFGLCCWPLCIFASLPTLEGHRRSYSPDSHFLSFSFSLARYSYHSCTALPLCNSMRCSSCFVMSLFLAAPLRLRDLTIQNQSKYNHLAKASQPSAHVKSENIM